MLCITVPQLLQQLLCLVIGILMDPINREVLVIGILMDPMLLEYFVLLLRAILLLVVGRARNASYLCSGSVPWYQKRYLGTLHQQKYPLHQDPELHTTCVASSVQRMRTMVSEEELVWWRARTS